MKTKMTDSDVQQAVLRELKWDTHVKETEVGVEVNAGVVTLSGTVDNWGKRIAAQKAAHRVAGVLDVANEVEVKLAFTPGRTDTDIAHAIRHALEWDVFVPEQRIRSTVSDGWVSLEGDVDYWTEREDAEKSLRNLAGVRGISNSIAVKARATKVDVKKSIEDALSRRAKREASRIDIEVVDGDVDLFGTVDSFAAKQAVLGVVKSSEGVRKVGDHLRIEPFAN